jgi:hypothetical protein
MSPRLPRWQVRSTIAILALSVVTTLVGVFRAGHYRDPPDLAASYQVQDATVLLLGVPVLAVGVVFAARGSLRGRIVWLGGLAFVTYVWASVGLQVSFNEAFLVYVALSTLSLFTLVGGVAGTDPEAVRDALAGRISRPLYAGALAVIGVGLAALWLSEIVPALLSGTDPVLVQESGQSALVSHFFDLAVVVPALLLAAAWLLRDRAWGYVFAGVLLVLGALLAVTIPAMTLVLSTGETVSVPPVAVVFTMVPVLLAAVLAVRYVVAVGTGEAAGRRRRGDQAV